MSSYSVLSTAELLAELLSGSKLCGESDCVEGEHFIVHDRGVRDRQTAW